MLKNVDDELFGSFAAPVFLTLLHRLHRYTVDRNVAGALTRPPLGVATPDPSHPRPSLGSRIRHWLFGRSGGDETVLKDPLTVMQFRAIEWFFANQEHLMEKRTRVQALRQRPDREIFQRFPIYYVPTYPGDDQLMSSKLFEFLRPDVRSVDRRLDEIIQT